MAAILEDMRRRTCIIIIIIIHGYRSLKIVNFCAVVGCSSRSNRDKDKSFIAYLQLLLIKAYNLKNCLKEGIDLGLLRYEGKTLRQRVIYAYVRVCSEWKTE